MPPVISLNTVERSDDLSNNLVKLYYAWRLKRRFLVLNTEHALHTNFCSYSELRITLKIFSNHATVLGKSTFLGYWDAAGGR
jgi:hypothetical protein